ncbi:hypothetical protein D3C81_2071320 [compost metagenome]
MQVGQVHRDGGGFGQHLAVHHQCRHATGGIDRQIRSRLLFVALKVQLMQLMLDAQLNQQPMHHE